MKPSVFIVNTARGAIFDQDALVEALRTKRIAGAGLDVYVDEPTDLTNPFLTLDNVIVAPHFASYTKVAYDQLDRNAFAKVQASLAGSELWDVKNKEVLPKRRYQT